MSSPVLGRHLSGLPHRALLRLKDRPTLLSSRSSSRYSATLQHIQTKKPLFSTWLLANGSIDEAMSTEGPAFRVWLPSGRCQPFRPRKPLSAPHALGLHSSRLCPDSGAGLEVSQKTFRSCAFSPNCSAWHRRFSGFRLLEPVVPSCSPTLFQVKVGPLPS
jgi:hypothetical protein